MEDSKTLISSNFDFLFIYEAIQCNPNGDPDQENKPRMDYENNINLVTDVRLKRYIRDYLKISGKEIFVDMEGDSKVSPDTKLKIILTQIINDEEKLNNILNGNEEYLNYFNKLKKDNNNDTDKIIKSLAKLKTDFNIYFLSQLIKQRYIDIRLFGSAFAVSGFNKSYTGPVQINWGYSLNKVSLMDSNSLVTIMNDDESTFGKDYRLFYSLIAFNGSINKNAAISTNLTKRDVIDFRDAIWESIPALATRSKFNQFPKLYLEIEYNDGYNNGYFGDLRNLIKVTTNNKLEFNKVRRIDDLNIDFGKLINSLNANKGNDKVIKNITVKKSDDISIELN